VSRQRYWGTPIPIIYCKQCGEQPVPLDQLPVTLPDVENYRPTETGQSPLAAIADSSTRHAPAAAGPAERETDTMAGSVDSSWYFLRFTSPHEKNAAWDRAGGRLLDARGPVHRGREHAVGHLLYARFWTKGFHDAGLIGFDEPFQTLRNQGMLLAETLSRPIPATRSGPTNWSRSRTARPFTSRATARAPCFWRSDGSRTRARSASRPCPCAAKP
jgi:leucyl-tRNA synthetase